jgi:hypothetical protein
MLRNERRRESLDRLFDFPARDFCVAVQAWIVTAEQYQLTANR